MYFTRVVKCSLPINVAFFLQANLKPEDLSIGYDTEAAALFCRNVGEKDEKFKAGTRYMILDAGGIT